MLIRPGEVNTVPPTHWNTFQSTLDELCRSLWHPKHPKIIVAQTNEMKNRISMFLREK
jgi:hypothetical protein